jgi:hypothetical protein
MIAPFQYFTISGNTNLIKTIMKRIAKKSLTRSWIMFLLVSMSMVTLSAAASSATLKIGDSYGGGVVLYVDATGQHGLIAAKTDVLAHSSGKVEGFFSWYGANVAANAFVEGYGDWFLPNKEQLNQLYLNKQVVGGTMETYYWSSSESDANDGWGQDFTNGEQVAGRKTNGSHVRAVRIF